MPLEIVQSKKCDQYLFTPNRIVSKEAKEDIIKSCLEKNNNFQCHKGTIKNINVICHGFYKMYNNPAISSMLESLGEIEFVVVK